MVVPVFVFSRETCNIVNSPQGVNRLLHSCISARMVLSYLLLSSAIIAQQPKTSDSTYTALSCVVQTRNYGQSDAGMKLIMFNGVPVTGMVFDPLARELVEKRTDICIIVADLPGTGESRLTDTSYSWSTQRTCAAEYLADRDDHFLLVHDAAGPVVLPILPRLENIRGIIILNTVLKPTELEPPFPLSFMHSSRLAKPLAKLTPFFYYNSRMRSLGITHNELVSKKFMRRLFEDTGRDGGMARLTEVMRGFELTHRSDSLIKKGLADPRPQLVIWADEDPVLGDQFLYLEPGHPNRIVHHLPEAKHFFMLDHAEETAGRILEWLDRWDRH